MLVLSRKPGEAIVIGGDIRVIVQRVRGRNVTLSIDAPDKIRIMRGELQPHLPPPDPRPPAAGERPAA